MVTLSQKSLFIFDWDGTLMDSIGLIVQSMQLSAQAQQLSISHEAVKSIIGLSLISAVEKLFPNHLEKHQAIIQGYSDYYFAYNDETKLFDGIEDLLKKLSSQNKLLAVATGKKRIGLEQVFASSGAKPYFVTSRCADESGSKPNPTMLLEILAETKQEISDAVLIGDSVYDIQMAKAIGMDSVAVNYGCEKAEILASFMPTYQVDSVAELSKLLIL